MKAIVLSVKKGQAALLLENGMTTYRRMKVSPGDRVEIPDVTAAHHRVVMFSRVVAAMLVVAVGLTLYYTNIAMAYSYISVDVNPSVEFSLNRLNTVLNVTSRNTDGASLVEELERQSVNGMKIGDAMELLMNLVSDSDYSEKDGSVYMLVAVSSKKDHMVSVLSEQIEHTVSENGHLEYLVLPSSVEERDKAAELGLSTGRYLEMIQSEGKSEPEKKLVEQYRSTSVRDFIEPETVKKGDQDSSVEKSTATEKESRADVSDDASRQKSKNTAEPKSGSSPMPENSDAAQSHTPNPGNQNIADNRPTEQTTPKPAEQNAPKPDNRPAERNTPKPAEQNTPKPAKQNMPKPAEQNMPKPSEQATPKPDNQPAEQTTPKPSERNTPNPDNKPGEQTTPPPDNKPGEQTTPNPDNKPGGETTPPPDNKPGEQATPPPDNKPGEQNAPPPDNKQQEGGSVLWESI